MLLAIDAGNSNVVFGLSPADDGPWTRVWRLETHPLLPPADYLLAVRSQLLEAGVAPDQLRRVVVSSVVPDLLAPLRALAHELVGDHARLMGPDLYGCLPVSTLRPYEIGSDLMANALAAWHRYRSAAIVVDFGTALTFTLVDGNGQVVAVNIVPGLKTALRALAGSTAKLPEVPLEMPDSVLGRNTVHAIQAGVFFGYTDLVTGMVGRMRNEHGADCRVVATGGLSSVLTGLRPLFDGVEPHLTLDGLRLADRYARAATAP